MSYRCHDMQRACNHAGHIGELECLVYTQAIRISELEAERDRALNRLTLVDCYAEGLKGRAGFGRHLDVPNDIQKLTRGES